MNVGNNFKFIILGAGRGGTSLLMALLDAHSKLEVASEFATQSHLMGRDFECIGSDIYQERVNAFNEKCLERASLANDKIWGNKITTEQIFGLEDHNKENLKKPINILECFFLESFKEKKKIFILRDGRNCVSSKVKRTGQPMQQACDRWNYSVSMYEFLKNKDDNSLSLKFENLVNAPERELRKICTFLDIEFETEMLKGVSSNKLMPEYQHGEFVSSKANPKTIPDEYLALIKDNLIKCGYRDESD